MARREFGSTGFYSEPGRHPSHNIDRSVNSKRQYILEESVEPKRWKKIIKCKKRVKFLTVAE